MEDKQEDVNGKGMIARMLRYKEGDGRARKEMNESDGKVKEGEKEGRRNPDDEGVRGQQGSLRGGHQTTSLKMEERKGKGERVGEKGLRKEDRGTANGEKGSPPQEIGSDRGTPRDGGTRTLVLTGLINCF